MNLKNIAIILVNYNGLKDTVECVESLKRLKDLDETEIIIVDNGSNENEGAELKKLYPDITVIISKENLGFAGGNNLAIDYAIRKRFPYILLLNNDTVVDESLLENLICEQDGMSIIVPKMLYYFNKKTIWYGGGEINRKTGNAIHYHINEIDQEEVSTVVECSFATGCCMLIPCSVINKIGKFNDTYFMYCEDTEFCLRAVNNGIKIRYVPSAKLWHKVSQSTGGDESAFSIYYMTRNRIRYIKDYARFFLPSALVFTILSRIARAFYCMLKKKKEWKVFLKAINDAQNGITGEVHDYY